jgi:hypothetical protein
MRLEAYLKREKLTLSAFARQIGTKHARTVERHAKGYSIPSREMMARITTATGGEVTANDFFAPIQSEAMSAGTSE